MTLIAQRTRSDSPAPESMHPGAGGARARSSAADAARAGRFALALVQGAGYTRDPLRGVRISIADAAGAVVMTATVDVPALLAASLAPGAYTAVATYRNQVKLCDIDVRPDRLARVMLEWGA